MPGWKLTGIIKISKLMKKYFLNAACLCLCAGLAFTSCDKDDESPETNSINPIVATVVDGSSYDPDRVEGYLGNSLNPLATAPYSNGGFTLTLPETVDDEYLQKQLVELADEFTVSDTNAKTNYLQIYGYKSNNIMGEFRYMNPSTSMKIEAHYMYSDRDVSVTGSRLMYDDENLVYDLYLKAGWNIVYMIPSSTGITYSASDPGGFVWTFILVD